MRKLFWYPLVLVAVLAGDRLSIGQQSTDEFAALKARIEALERQNGELRQAFADRLPPIDQHHVGLRLTSLAFEGDAPPEDAAFRAAMDRYLKDQDAQKKAEDEAKKAAGYEVGSDLKMNATWNNGLELSTANKDFRIHIGGRTQMDVGWFSVDPNVYTAAGGPTAGLGNTYGDGGDFRRARLRIDGYMYETIEWQAEYDFVNSATLGAQPSVGAVPFTPGNLANQPRTTTAPTDLHWTFRELPILGNLRIGNQKEAIGFDHLVSSRYQPFMERSYNQDTFYGGLFNGFTPGIQAFDNYGEEDIGLWQLGLFKPTNNVFAFNTGDGDYDVTGRLTRVLFYQENGRQLLHLGGSLRQGTGVSQAIGSNGSTTTARLQTFRTRDAIRTGLSANWPTPANITLFGDDIQQVNGELCAVNGPWTFQSEYLVSSLQDARTAVGNPLGVNAIYHGGYIQIFRFLTNDHDNYNKKTAVFERVKPTENFFLVRDSAGCRCFGTGAWQVGARYNYLDLNSRGLNGGILHNFSGGVNWFLNPNMKIQFDYIATYRDAPLAAGAGDGWIQGWGMRFAQDF